MLMTQKPSSPNVGSIEDKLKNKKGGKMGKKGQGKDRKIWQMTTTEHQH